MKKSTTILLTCLTLFFAEFSFSQEFNGIATYQSKTTFEMNFEGRNIPPDQQERIKQRMKSIGEREYKLQFNMVASLYQEEEKLDQPGQGGGRMRFGGWGAGKSYKNVDEGRFTQENDLQGKEFLIKDELETFNWEMQGDTKMIGNYLCFKATAKQEVPNVRARFGRRGGNNDEPVDSLKTIEITAWYTLDIPVKHGPGNYWGLPGLILDINADNTTILCTKIVLNPKESLEIKEPKKGKEVTQQEFNEIQAAKIKEMREIYSGRNQGRGRGF